MCAKIRLSCLFVFMTVVAGYAAPSSEMRFRGAAVRNSSAGILIEAKDKNLIVLSNSKLHYALILPYSEDWVFDTKEPYHLKGNAGLLNMDIQILRETDLSPEEQIAQLKEYLVSDKNPATPSKINEITHQGSVVLRTEVDTAKINAVFQGVKHINFYCSKKMDGDLYKLHFSKVVPADGSDSVADKKILDFVTAGFFVDLGREQEFKEPQPRSFALPKHGQLTLNVPNTWKQTVPRPSGNLPPTITFTPAQGDEFQVLITPIWSPKKDKTFNRPDEIKTQIENERDEMLPSAVEKEVPIQEFKSVDGTGFYFLLTDKAPKPGEYPYVVRAGVGVGDLSLSVTVLSRSKDTEGITATIKALQEAKQMYE